MHTALHTDIAPQRQTRQPVAREKSAVRSDAMRRAWALWKLAQDVAKRPAFDHWAIVNAAKDAGKSHREAVALADADYADRRKVASIRMFGDAIRAAWVQAKRHQARIADAARPTIRNITLSPEDTTEADARMIAGIAAFGNE